MFKKSLIPLVVATALVGCGGDDKAEIDGNNRGSIEIIGSDFFAGATLSASVSDADGIQASTLTYAWSTGATGTSYVITEADEGSVITVSAVYTDEAGFTEGVGASTPTIQPTLDVNASVVKGPVAGASCDIYAVDDSGAAEASSQATASSADSGSITFTNVHFEGTGLVSCTGGTYVDEATGETLDAPLLRAVIDVVESDSDEDIAAGTGEAAPTYVVSPLTEMAVQAAGADLTSFEEQAAIINARFGIRFDTTQVAPTAVGVTPLGADGAADADRYGSVLALLSQLDADDADSDMAAVLATVAADLADGSFSEALLNAFELAQTNLQTTSAVAADVDEDLLNVIGSAVGYNNDPVAAIIEGTLSGTIQNTATDPLTGTVIVNDPNFEEDAVIAQSDVVLDFGTFSISANGNWSYTVDTANETVANLEVGSSVNDSVTIESVDGTTADIEIRIAALTQVAKITDIGNDTGEIRFSVDNLRQGKLSASFSKEVALGSDGNVKDAYITLYGLSGSSSESLIDLRIQGTQTTAEGETIEPRFFVRNTDSDAYPGDIITADFTEEQFYDVEITWDLDAAEQLTVTIDGEVIGGGSFSTAAVVDPDFTDLDQWFVDGVRTIQFRFGDNDRTIPFGAYYVDNIEVASDTSGETVVFSDDFEGYDVGETLAGDGSLYSLAIYSEVVVFDAGDGSVEQTPAVFFDLAGSLPSDSTEPLTGMVSIIDPNEGEAAIIEASGATTFGSYSILEDGSWTYTLDTSNEVIAALISGERETDTITIESVDGTTAELVITITGVGGVSNGPNKVAVIVDTLDSDTGELRYALGGDLALAAGRIEVSVKRLDDDLGNGDAFITLFNSATNNSGAILDLRIRDDSFGVRSPSDVDTSAATVLLDQFMDVVITWEYPGGDLELLPLVTVEIDGVRFTAEGFTPDNSATGGVTHVAFRFGDNGGVREATGKFSVDDLFIFSDTAGTTEVFSDDFESYADGDSLDTDNPASPYNSSTSEATVEASGDVGGPGTDGNKIAEIRDTLDSDTGELRYALGTEPLAQGRFEVAIKRLDDDLGNGDAFITLFNSATNNSGALLDLRVRDDSFGVRSPSDIDTSAASVVLDQFMNVVVTWEYPGGDLTVTPLITVEIDGVRLTAEGFTPDNSSTGGLTHVAIRFGDNGGVREATGVVSVDNIAIYSDTAGTTQVFADDFEGYVEGDSLDTDNAASPYNSSTSEAVVAVE
ncbi:VCBS domain-containing protein [Glaciecola sp. MH2013]|uniref:VCBS domain-containing protein n=1 Tax=Glaciecola sp. MH2013 TaxID=2785524 RepID=UPI00189E5502|nr:VCBS domain-containing protein [Glaciecola sp. MH2013]MBF7074162.1 VCBS domain-containing protein [Glaciecola sp. MH2013]